MQKYAQNQNFERKTRPLKKIPFALRAFLQKCAVFKKNPENRLGPARPYQTLGEPRFWPRFAER